MNHLEQLIDGAILSRRAMLIGDGMHGDTGLNAGQQRTGFWRRQGLDDRKRSMLSIVGQPPPPDHAEDLPRLKVVHHAVVTLLMAMDGISKAERVNQGASFVS
jgi:hypothetical protein